MELPNGFIIARVRGKDASNSSRAEEMPDIEDEQGCLKDLFVVVPQTFGKKVKMWNDSGLPAGHLFITPMDKKPEHRLYGDGHGWLVPFKALLREKGVRVCLSGITDTPEGAVEVFINHRETYSEMDR